ncbi:uncharacterized protein B0H18DRAFT_1206343 [Fomitopsis serialis]|uniref:uncharacterized protein n=1 Tax=Fomitopsis serialis TaxID=139415 RepID=UPI002007BF00|nr:uncharacterized protein B0H18DRAFT_1206343 [Neoantrodia serialis]KAH9937514.1 hypothetical protein B0H18DRAFT_1206343 [Neoantrodia serialis]
MPDGVSGSRSSALFSGSVYAYFLIGCSAFLGNSVVEAAHSVTVQNYCGDGLLDGSSTAVINLVPTNYFSDAVSFSYYNACTGAGASCLNSDCTNAEHVTDNSFGAVNCAASSDPNSQAGLSITWCPQLAPASSSSSSSASATSESTSATGTSSTPGSAATAAAASGTSHSTPVGAIVGGVVGGVGGVALILFVALFFLMRSRKRARRFSDIPYSKADEVEHGTQPTPFLLQSLDGSGMPPTNGTQPHGQDRLTPVPVPVMPSPSTVSSKAALVSQTVPLPYHTASVTTTPPSASTETTTSSSSYSGAATTESSAAEPSLDRIVEGLAARFGWTAPPPEEPAPGLQRRDTLPPYS